MISLKGLYWLYMGGTVPVTLIDLYLYMHNRLLKGLFFLLFIGYFPALQAQLGFCQGNSGAPIFTENFGTGTTNGPALPPGATTYTYVNGAPDDGSYTIASNTAGYFEWFNTPDHTPDDVSGKMFIVNAGFTPGEFFSRTIDGLCENTSYEFSAWLMNLLPRSGCLGDGIPINVRFQIYDSTGTNLLASGDTGDIQGKTAAEWEQYALVFTTVPGQSSVILKMGNNGGGGCGNDLAIDDIVFRSCGDRISLTDPQTQNSIVSCREDGAISTILSATPDFTIFSSHYYQWQESLDNSTWADIPGENTDSYTTPVLTDNHYYRVKVAEDPINLTNDLCNVLSEVFEIIFVNSPAPPLSTGTVGLCSNEERLIRATVPNGVTVNWYDAPTGGTLLEANSVFLTPESAGTYYAEAVTVLGNCPSATRTPVTLDIYPIPAVTDETVFLCENSLATLEAGVDNVSYTWNTGETSSSITVNTPGTFTVEVTDAFGCSASKTIEVIQIDLPVIEQIISIDYDIRITAENPVGLEYSLDGINFQEDPVFVNVPAGSYETYVRNSTYCDPVLTEYVHLVVPKFFTPNGDSINDTFEIGGIEGFSNYEINIFNRFGQLLIQQINEPMRWDGTFNNRLLPSGDYWYTIQAGDRTYSGHFTLKR